MDRRTRAIYGVGHFGKTLIWSASSLTFAFFLTEVVGLRPALMGQILALSLLVNGASDALMGWWLRQRAGDLQSAGIVHAGGATLASFALVAFALAGSVPEPHRATYAIATLLVFRLGYSAYDVPQNAMLALAAGDDALRGAMTTVRYAAAGLATVVVAVVLTRWIALDGSEARSVTFVWMSVVLGSVAIATACLTAVTMRSVATIALATPRVIAMTPSVVPMLLSIAIYSGIMSIFVKLQPYFVAFSPASSMVAVNFILIAAIGQVAMQPVWGRLTVHRSLNAVFRAAAVALAVTGVLFTVFASGNDAGLALTALCYGAASSGTLVGIWSLMASATAKSGEAAVRLFGAFTFVSKSAQAFGILAVGYILDNTGYRGEAGNTTVALWMGGAVICVGVGCATVSVLWLKSHRRQYSRSARRLRRQYLSGMSRSSAR